MASVLLAECREKYLGLIGHAHLFSHSYVFTLPLSVPFEDKLKVPAVEMLPLGHLLYVSTELRI